MILTQEEISQLTVEQAQAKLDALESLPMLDRHYTKLTNAQWLQADDIANTLLWLEDHIASQKKTDQMAALNQARWGNKE